MANQIAVSTEKCIGCGLCAKLCPVNAIMMEEKRPRIDAERRPKTFALVCEIGEGMHPSQFG